MPLQPIEINKRSNARSYNDGCAAAHALDLVGERWALLIVRELLLGPKRFTDLRSGLAGISPNVLAQRLAELESTSIVRRRRLAPPGAVWVYELTDWGAELEPVIMALGRWGARSPSVPQGDPIGVDSLILSFRTMFDPHRAAGLEASLELRLLDDTFHVHIRDGGLRIERGGTESPDATVVTDPNALAALVYARQPLGAAVRAGNLKIVGDKAVVKRFLGLFPLPSAAPALRA